MERVQAIHWSRGQLTREERQARLRVRNEPPRLTAGEEAVNAVSHGLGAVLAVAALVALLGKSEAPLEVLASCVYGGSMVFMMLMSCLYHALRPGSAVKRVWRRLDYCSIYLLIGGTFAPIFLVYLGGKLGVALFSVQWAVIFFGVTLIAVFGPGKWKPLHYTLYFLIGWSGLALLPDFYRRDRTLLWAVLLGGVVYTVGMVPFARRRKYSHCVWHVFVLLGAALHWAGIYTRIY